MWKRIRALLGGARQLNRIWQCRLRLRRWSKAIDERVECHSFHVSVKNKLDSYCLMSRAGQYDIRSVSVISDFF